MENPPSMRDQIKSIHDEHEDQFNISINAAFQRGFGRWFDDTWTSARAAGALPNPFISSMFVFFTTMLTKKFVAGLPTGVNAEGVPVMPIEAKEQAISKACTLLKGYLDQIESAAIKDLHNPKPDPVTPKGNQKQTIILPKKKFRH